MGSLSLPQRKRRLCRFGQILEDLDEDDLAVVRQVVEEWLYSPEKTSVWLKAHGKEVGGKAIRHHLRFNECICPDDVLLKGSRQSG